MVLGNWISAIHCCDIENSGELKLSQLDQKINASFDFSHLCYGEKFSIFAVKALNGLKRGELSNSALAETSRNEVTFFLQICKINLFKDLLIL